MTTTTEVKEAFAHMDEVDVTYIPGLKRTAVTVHETSIGQFFAAVNDSGFDYKAKRLNDCLVAHIDSEREGLGELFG